MKTTREFPKVVVNIVSHSDVVCSRLAVIMEQHVKIFSGAPPLFIAFCCEVTCALMRKYRVNEKFFVA